MYSYASLNSFLLPPFEMGCSPFQMEEGETNLDLLKSHVCSQEHMSC